jgi:hypothetical protein
MTNDVSPLLFILLLTPGGLIAERIATANPRAGIVVNSLEDVLRKGGS